MNPLSFKRSRLLAIASVILALGWASVVRSAEPSTNVYFILDASGSMWGRVEGGVKIAIAKKVLGDLVKDLPDGLHAGLMVYGHRRKGDCQDIEPMIPLGPLDKPPFISRVQALKPKGKTPITASIRQAARMLRGQERETKILLVSDGKETCQGDPCALVEELKAAGLKFAIHVIGFDVTAEEREQLECIAKGSGGVYYSARNANEFLRAVHRAADDAIKPKGPALAIGAMKHGKALTATITLSQDGRVVARGDNSITNPEKFYLDPGVYDVEAVDTSLDQRPSLKVQGIEFSGEEDVAHMFVFDEGYLSLEVTKNGDPSYGDIKVYPARGGTLAAADDTSIDNPATIALLPGAYDVEVTDPGLAGEPSLWLRGIAIVAGQRVAREVRFSEGTLSVRVIKDGSPAVADIRVRESGREGRLASGDTSSHNPEDFKLPPGAYDVSVKYDDRGKDLETSREGIVVGQGKKVTIEFSF